MAFLFLETKSVTKTPVSLIVTIPQRCSSQAIKKHLEKLQLLLELLPKSDYQLDKMVLVGPAAVWATKPQAVEQLYEQELSALECWRNMSQALNTLAQNSGCECLVCGQAAGHYGLRDESLRQEQWQLTGYMEVLALLSKASAEHKVICLNDSTSSEALVGALGVNGDALQNAEGQGRCQKSCDAFYQAEKNAFLEPAFKPDLRVVFSYPPRGKALSLAACATANYEGQKQGRCQWQGQDLTLAQRAENAWSWEQGLNMVINAAELDLKVTAYFIDQGGSDEQQQQQGEHKLDVLSHGTLVKQLKQLELYDIQCFFAGQEEQQQHLEKELAPLKLLSLPVELSRVFIQSTTESLLVF